MTREEHLAQLARGITPEGAQATLDVFLMAWGCDCGSVATKQVTSPSTPTGRWTRTVGYCRVHAPVSAEDLPWADVIHFLEAVAAKKEHTS